MGPPGMWDEDTLCLTLERSTGASWSSATWALGSEWARLRGLVLERQVKTWQPLHVTSPHLLLARPPLPRIRPSSTEHLQSGVGIRQYLLRPFDRLQCVRCVHSDGGTAA